MVHVIANSIKLTSVRQSTHWPPLSSHFPASAKAIKPTKTLISNVFKVKIVYRVLMPCNQLTSFSCWSGHQVLEFNIFNAFIGGSALKWKEQLVKEEKYFFFCYLKLEGFLKLELHVPLSASHRKIIRFWISGYEFSVNKASLQLTKTTGNEF